MALKIVYYGPGLCGKTTNLNVIYAKTTQKQRGEMISMNTQTDRTLFFDLLPMDVGIVGGFKTKLQVYTVPGQVFYNATRKLVLKGVDGIVFVADSQQAMLDANRESLQNLRENLSELGLKLEDIPLVFQWNKRDLKNITPVEVLEANLNPVGPDGSKRPSFSASAAVDHQGVFDTLRGITRLVIDKVKPTLFGTEGDPAAAEKKQQASKPSRPDLVEAPVEADVQRIPPVAIPPVVAAPAPVAPAAAPPAPVAPAAAPPAHKKGVNINALLSDLSKSTSAPPVIKVEIPSELADATLDLVLQVRCGDVVVGEISAQRNVPNKGASVRVNFEVKRKF
jgi:hypothetical protein